MFSFYFFFFFPPFAILHFITPITQQRLGIVFIAIAAADIGDVKTLFHTFTFANNYNIDFEQN